MAAYNSIQPVRGHNYGRALTKKETEAIRLLSEGYTQLEVCEQLKMGVHALRNLIRRDDVRAIQLEAVNKYLESAAGKAAKVLIKQMDHENPWIAQQAARTVLQHIETISRNQESTVNVNFINMPLPSMPVPETVETEGREIKASGDVT